ncbi:MAG: leucine--tRNA ligase [Candidatus Woesebacteria bacterium]|jgi:leucyl-tRNA synthetase
MKRYNPKEIEPKWQQVWDETKIYQATNSKDQPKNYILDFFPYPSGAAMHVGHVRNYTISDALARYARMQGFNVLHPMGWDAFGLPAENFAIKTSISPQQAVAQNTGKFKQQLSQMGIGIDWSREFASSDPDYYKWTQWFFTLLFERGLAYQKESPQWWCETDKTVLANEQVEAGRCWRCGNEVTKKPLKQWFFKITDYADRLIEDLDKFEATDSLKNMQRNWIGRSKGAQIDFEIKGSNKKLKIFTTRADTLFGVTFMALAPEHPIIGKICTAEMRQNVEDYIAESQNKSEVDRMDTNREKTGVFTGAYAINPLTKQEIPIWVADYVLMGYGTGAIMAVPAHDERDFEFAEKFKLPIIEVIKSSNQQERCYHGEGTMLNSGRYDGMQSSEIREKVVADLAKNGIGKEKINYKIRDWLISRQRYWGAPIPIIHCPEHGAVAVPKDHLPVKLPEITDYKPAGDGQSPLAKVDEWVNTTCPKCGRPAKRETDTMDGFACSSWYMWRFIDPKNNQEPFSKEKVDHWGPVDTYVGGAEHAVMHLLYVRFWTKVMFDAGLIDFEEPFKALRNQGMILAPDGRKMSKSWGNVIAPDDLIAEGYGADSIRVMELFIGPWNQAANWSIEGLGGCYRFLQRVWAVSQEYLQTQQAASNSELEVRLLRATHKTIKKVTDDLDSMSFNTAIAALMEFVNELYKVKTELMPAQGNNAWCQAVTALAQMIAPFAPHIAEEIWHQIGNENTVHLSGWPVADQKYLVDDVISIVVQINGKLRSTVDVPADSSEQAVKEAALSDKRINELLVGSEPKRVIYVAGRLVNIVA